MQNRKIQTHCSLILGQYWCYRSNTWSVDSANDARAMNQSSLGWAPWLARNWRGNMGRWGDEVKTQNPTHGPRIFGQYECYRSGLWSVDRYNDAWTKNQRSLGWAMWVGRNWTLNVEKRGERRCKRLKIQTHCRRILGQYRCYGSDTWSVDSANNARAKNQGSLR